MNLIKIAKILYKFERTTNWDTLYQTIMKDSFFNEFKDILSASDIVKVVYLAQEIGNKGEPEKLLKKLDGLYVFSILDFEDNEQYVECGDCGGDGVVDCGRCDSTGTEECRNCDGRGVEECPNCDGTGEYMDERCDECDGQGEIVCGDCEGGGETSCPDCIDGYVTCGECGGQGEIEETDYVPFLNSQYVSYNKELLNALELTELRNEEVSTVFNKYNDDFHLIDSLHSAVGEEDSLNINPEFQFTAHVNGITSLYYLNKTTYGTLSNSDLYNIDEKFYN